MLIPLIGVNSVRICRPTGQNGTEFGRYKLSLKPSMACRITASGLPPPSLV